MPSPIRLDGPSSSPPSPPADRLSALVAAGNTDGVRAFMDEVFWEGRPERPGWEHLKIALLRKDRQMLRLLHTWGAAPADSDMLKFKATTQEAYPDYLRALRAAGFAPRASWENPRPPEPAFTEAEISKRAYEIYCENHHAPGRDVVNWLQAEEDLKARKRRAWEKENAAEAAFCDDIVLKKKAADMLAKVPQDWQRVLKAFHQAGAEEAVIAGPALRDVFNGRKPGGVDIFLRARGSAGKNVKCLNEAFRAAGFGAALCMQQTPRHVGSHQVENWWKVQAATVEGFNVSFLDSYQGVGPIFADHVLGLFDIGLNQAVYDGKRVVTTRAYSEDTGGNRISLLRPSRPAAEDLAEIAKKYPDWTLNPAAQAALKDTVQEAVKIVEKTAPKPPSGPRPGHGYRWPAPS